MKKLDNRLVIMKMSYFAKIQSDSAALRGSSATLDQSGLEMRTTSMKLINYLC